MIKALNLHLVAVHRNAQYAVQRGVDASEGLLFIELHKIDRALLYQPLLGFTVIEGCCFFFFSVQ